ATRASWVRVDTQRNMLPGLPNSASCVQSFDDSLNSAIRITYRISLRSSSLREPRYPSLKVVLSFVIQKTALRPLEGGKHNTLSVSEEIILVTLKWCLVWVAVDRSSL